MNVPVKKYSWGTQKKKKIIEELLPYSSTSYSYLGEIEYYITNKKFRYKIYNIFLGLMLLTYFDFKKILYMLQKL
jgi:hypothetical protein